jgi:ATP-dependent RNA helicase MSS116
MQVRRISQVVLKREHKYVDTVGMGCVETPVEVSYSNYFQTNSYEMKYILD